MITNNDKLDVFENFYVDRNLPKFRKHEEHQTSQVDTPMSGNSMDPVVPSRIMVRQDTGTFDIHSTEHRQIIDYLRYVRSASPTLANKFRYFFAKRVVFTRHGRGKAKREHLHVDYEDIGQFFANMHTMMTDLDLKEKDIKYYEDIINNAMALGQQALVELLMTQRDTLLAELSMIKDHKVKYVTEKEVVSYYKKAKHSEFLHMAWITNFTRVVPPEVAEMKKYCDERGWFDNYAVLYFDRKGESAQMTAEQKRMAADPILFGLIQNSDKLYFVADWEDEYCDLTLDKMLKVIGKDVLTLNSASVKSRIEKMRAD